MGTLKELDHYPESPRQDGVPPFTMDAPKYDQRLRESVMELDWEKG